MWFSGLLHYVVLWLDTTILEDHSSSSSFIEYYLHCYENL
jgi:hypothetical protein